LIRHGLTVVASHTFLSRQLFSVSTVPSSLFRRPHDEVDIVGLANSRSSFRRHEVS